MLLFSRDNKRACKTKGEVQFMFFTRWRKRDIFEFQLMWCQHLYSVVKSLNFRIIMDPLSLQIVWNYLKLQAIFHILISELLVLCEDFIDSIFIRRIRLQKVSSLDLLEIIWEVFHNLWFQKGRNISVIHILTCLPEHNLNLFDFWSFDILILAIITQVSWVLIWFV